MHGRRGVLELDEGAITFAPRACIDDATGKYCISQQGSLYQLGVPAADEALEAAALVAAGALSEEGEQEKTEKRSRRRIRERLSGLKGHSIGC